MNEKSVLICTLDSETEKGVLRLMEDIAKVDVYVPTVKIPKKKERIDPSTTKITRIESIEFNEKGDPLYGNNYRPLTEDDFKKDRDRVYSVLDEAIFQLISDSEISYKNSYIITHDKEDQHWHHAIVGEVVYHQRMFPWNILTSGHDAFNGGIVKDIKIDVIDPTDEDVYMKELKNIEFEREHKYRVAVSKGLEYLAVNVMVNSTRRGMRYSNISKESFNCIRWSTRKDPIYVPIEHPEFALRGLAEIEVHRDVKWGEKVSEKEINKMWKKYYEESKRTFKKCKRNWFNFLESAILKDMEKNPKLYHSLIQSIAERLVVPYYAMRERESNIRDMTVQELTETAILYNILYPIKPVILENIYYPKDVIGIFAHQDDPVITYPGIF